MNFHFRFTSFTNVQLRDLAISPVCKIRISNCSTLDCDFARSFARRARLFVNIAMNNDAWNFLQNVLIKLRLRLNLQRFASQSKIGFFIVGHEKRNPSGGRLGKHRSETFCLLCHRRSDVDQRSRKRNERKVVGRTKRIKRRYRWTLSKVRHKFHAGEIKDAKLRHLRARRQLQFMSLPTKTTRCVCIVKQRACEFMVVISAPRSLLSRRGLGIIFAQKVRSPFVVVKLGPFSFRAQLDSTCFMIMRVGKVYNQNMTRTTKKTIKQAIEQVLSVINKHFVK